MSKQVDQRVVEMRFDNQHFEKNVSTTMSTLDKLKQKLNLSGASKGLENLGASAKKVDMSGLAQGVQAVHNKFSALEVMGVTALANITNSAVNAGKRIVKSLTIDPVTTGWNEYELKMGSIQTIMASTGESLESVNKYLNELNEYSDKTIYSFSDMTSNIGKFTNAGVELKDAVMAMKGISNEAALSGANANEASRAMYNFAQAISAGYVKLIDWKSIELANMATKGFKEELIKTAVKVGTLKEAGDGLYKTLNGKTMNATQDFNDSLKDEWMTTEVLISTLKDYADETTDIGKKATQAATEVKTFTQMLDALKESAQSGWAQTWEIIFGDFEEGKTLWTNINNVVGGILDKMSDVRNAFAKKVFGSKWDQLGDEIEKAGLSMEDFEKALTNIEGEDVIKELKDNYGSLAKAMNKGKISSASVRKALQKLTGVQDDLTDSTDEMTNSLSDYQSIADKVMEGIFGNAPVRYQKLTEAGYDWAYVQNIVNERLGSSVRHFTTLTEEQLKNADSLARLSDEQLKEKGYTEEQIVALKDLQAAAEGSNGSINDLINSIEKPSGRTLVIEAFSNAFDHFSKILGIVGDAWNDVFGDIDFGQTIYNIVEQIHEFTESLNISEKQAENFKNIMQGIFSGISISTTIFSKSVTSTIKLLDAIFEALGTDMLTVAGNVGLMITELADWIKENTLFMGSIGKLGDIIAVIYTNITKVINTFLGLERTQAAITRIKEMFANIFGSFDAGIHIMSVESIIAKINGLFMKIDEWVKGIDSTEDVGKYIIEGLVNGLKSGVSFVAKAIFEVATAIFETFCAFFDINSPSVLMMTLGTFLIAGLVNGIFDGESLVVSTIKNLASSIMTAFEDVAKNGIPYLRTLVKTVAGKILEYLGALDLGTLIATGMGTGMLITVYKLAKIAESILDPLKNLDKLFKNAAGAFDSLKQLFDGKILKQKIQNVTNLITAMAIAIVALAGALWIVAKIPPEDIERAGWAIAQIAGVVLILAVASALIEKYIGSLGSTAMSIVGVAATILVLALALRQMSEITNLKGVVDDTVRILLTVMGIFVLMSVFTSMDMGDNLNKAGLMFVGLGIALLLMSVAMKRISDLDSDEIAKGMLTLAALQLFFFELVAVARTCGDATSKAGGMLVKMSLALLLLVGVIKLIGMLDYADIVKALPVIIVLEAMFALLIAMSEDAGAHAGKAGIMMLGMAAVLLATILCIERIGKLDCDVILKGLGAVIVLGVLFGFLIEYSQYSGEHAAKAGAMLLMLSGAMLMLTGAVLILGKIPNDELWKAVGAIAILELLFMGLIQATQFAKDVKMGVFITLVVAIGILVASMMILASVSDVLPTVTLSLSMLMATFALLIAATSMIDSTKMFNKISILVVLAGIIAVLSVIVTDMANKIENPEAAIKSAEAMAVLLLTMSGVLLILTKMPAVDNSIYSAQLALAVLGVIVAEMGWILGKLNQNGLNTSMNDVKALSVMLLAMSGVLVILDKGFKGTNDISEAIAALTALSIVVGVLGWILGVLNKYDFHASMNDVLALSAMIGAMAGVIVLLDKFAVNLTGINKAVGSLFLLGIVVAEVGAILGMMSKNDMHASLNDVAALSIMLVAMTGILILLGATSGLTATAWLGIGALAALGLVVLEVGLILNELKKNDMMASTEDVKALSLMLIAMSASLIILAGVGALGGFALAGMAVLGAYIAGMTIILEALGALAMSPGYKEMMSGGAEVLATIGFAIGDFVGAIISGFGNGLMRGLPQMAEDLSAFMTSISGFIEGAKAIDNEAINGVKNLVEVIGEIGSMGLFDGIKSWFGGGSASLEIFAGNLNRFGEAMVDFSNLLAEGNFEGGRVKAAAAAAEMIATLYDKLPKTGGLLSGIFGTEDLGLFATQLAAFGGAIVGFSQAVSAKGAIDEGAVKSAAKCGEFIAELQDSLPETGGIIQQITGMKDLGLFGENLKTFGEAIVKFSSTVSEGNISEEAVKAAKTAGETMIALQDTLPNADGIWQVFTGEKDIGTFGTNLEKFGKALVAFSQAVSAEGAVDPAAIDIAKEAGVKMVDLAKSIPDDKIFDGKVSLSDFGLKISQFGSYIKQYSEKVTGLDNEAITNSTTAAEDLVEIAKDAANIDEDKIGNFSKVKSIGTTLEEYADSISEIDTSMVSSSVTLITRLVNAINDMASLNATGVDTFKSAIDSLGETNVKGVVDAFAKSNKQLSDAGMKVVDNIVKGMNSRQTALKSTVTKLTAVMYRQITNSLSAFNHAGEAIAAKMAAGIGHGRTTVKSAVRNTLSSGVTTARGYYTDFYSAGTYLVDGFAAGISARTWKAEAKAAAMAEAAETAAKEALDINSPSKVFRAIAYSIPEGFAMGIDKLSYLATDSASAMASKTIGGVKDAISRISDYMNEDIDSQPTIRPVMDLSDVKTGISAINGMFSGTQSVGVTSNVNAINSMMNQRNQNGANSDIISELNKLRGALGNIKPGDTYNINGITYDDGSAVSDAVSTLIRYTVMGGRA